jgi:hypothetical protein
MKNRVAILVAAVFMATGLLGTTGALPARAAVGPGEDRQISVPAGWWFYQGIDAATVNARLSTNGARLTDIKYEGGGLFTATMVKNSGSYASGWWWYYGKTATEVNSLATANGARPIVIQGYSTASGLRFVTIMISNTGANAESWSWNYGNASWIKQHVITGKRMVSFGRIQGTSYYTAIFGSNTGTDATGWWYYYGISMAQAASYASTNHARLVDLDRNSDTGTYNVVMYSTTGVNWHWYTGYSAGSLLEKAAQYGNRLFDISPYYVGGIKYFAALSIENLNGLSQKLRGIIAPKMDSGAYGFYLKQVGGLSYASLQSQKGYEPASALKILYHAKSIHEEALGNTNDATVITYHYHDLADPLDGNICPDSYATTTTTNLKNADTKMMQNSDNRMTRGILEKYGKPAMLSYAAALGLTSTAINHNIGCPTSTTHNRTTLVDLGKVYEAFQNSVVTTSSTWKAEFKSRMLNQSNYSGFKSAICPIVQQEATALGKSATVATNFCNAMTWIAKGGSYQYGGSLPYTVSWDGLSMTGVPYKASGVVAPRYFVFGEFVDGTQINSQAEADAINAARSKLYLEAMRPFIHSALTGW